MSWIVRTLSCAVKAEIWAPVKSYSEEGRRRRGRGWRWRRRTRTGATARPSLFPLSVRWADVCRCWKFRVKLNWRGQFSSPAAEAGAAVNRRQLLSRKCNFSDLTSSSSSSSSSFSSSSSSSLADEIPLSGCKLWPAQFYLRFFFRKICAFQIHWGIFCSGNFLSVFIPREIGSSAFSFRWKLLRRLIILRRGNQRFDQFSPEEYFGPKIILRRNISGQKISKGIFWLNFPSWKSFLMRNPGGLQIGCIARFLKSATMGQQITATVARIMATLMQQR